MTDEEILQGLDLLGDWLDAKGYTEEAGLCTRTMDRIHKLREALKPFAEKARHHTQGSYWMDAVFTVDECRAAAAALKETGDE